MLTPSFPQMQVQQLLQMKKQQQQAAAVQAAAAAQQKAGQPQQGQTTVQQKVVGISHTEPDSSILASTFIKELVQICSYSSQIGTQQVTVQAAQPGQQKVTYAASPQLQAGLKPQFFATSLAQNQKTTGAQQIQVDWSLCSRSSCFSALRSVSDLSVLMKSLSLRSHQMAKIPQIVQQQPTVANIQQIVTSPQQVGELPDRVL